MFVMQRCGGAQTPFTKLFNKSRLIFLEKVLEKITNKNGQVSYILLSGKANKISEPNKRKVLIINYSVYEQSNPDNNLIEEQVHTFNTYYGNIYLLSYFNPNVSDLKNLSLNDRIVLDDFNYNVIYNQVNRNSRYYENYTRYTQLEHSDAYRQTLDSIIEKIDCPQPKYFTMQESRHHGCNESMKDILLNSYMNNKTDNLLSFPLAELSDENTKISELTIVMNNLNQPYLSTDEKTKLKEDLYFLIGGIKYDMEITGISKITGLMTAINGFNLHEIRTQIQLNPQLTSLCVKQFLENLQSRYEEIFSSMVLFLPNNIDLQLYFNLEPINNVLEISFSRTDTNKLEMLQNDIHESLINTMF